MDGLPLHSSVFSRLLLSRPACVSFALAWCTAELLGPCRLLCNVINIDLIITEGRETGASSDSQGSPCTPLCAH